MLEPDGMMIEESESWFSEFLTGCLIFGLGAATIKFGVPLYQTITGTRPPNPKKEFINKCEHILNDEDNSIFENLRDIN